MWDSVLSLKQPLNPFPQFRAEIDHCLGKPIDEHAQQQDAYGSQYGLAVHLPDDFLVAPTKPTISRKFLVYERLKMSSKSPIQSGIMPSSMSVSML